MRVEIAKAMIKIGTNIITIGLAGVLLINDDVTVAFGGLAFVVGTAVLIIGIKLKESKNGNS